MHLFGLIAAFQLIISIFDYHLFIYLTTQFRSFDLSSCSFSFRTVWIAIAIAMTRVNKNNTFEWHKWGRRNNRIEHNKRKTKVQWNWDIKVIQHPNRIIRISVYLLFQSNYNLFKVNDNSIDKRYRLKFWVRDIEKERNKNWIGTKKTNGSSFDLIQAVLENW